MQGSRKEHTDKETKENPWKHEKRSEHVEYKNDYSRSNGIQLHNQARSFDFHSSTVTYGNANGEYYTSSTTRMTGSDGVTSVESKEAETATWQAKHMISSGLLNNGHSTASKLNSDGKVDTLQTLPNLNKDEADELLRFEQSWKGNDTPSLSENFIGYDNIDEADELAGFDKSWSGNDTPGCSEDFIGYDYNDVIQEAIEDPYTYQDYYP